METDPATPYALDKLQDRGTFFVDPGEEIYEGQVLGEYPRKWPRHQRRQSETNDQLPRRRQRWFCYLRHVSSPEEALEYIQGEGYVEVTPHRQHIRKIVLTWKWTPKIY